MERIRDIHDYALYKFTFTFTLHGYYLYLQTQFGEDRYTQFRVIVVTDPQTHTYTHKHTHLQSHKPTDMTDYNTLRR